MIAALDVAPRASCARQAQVVNHGFQGGFASPVIDGERLYQVDNGAVLGAFDLQGRQEALGAAARHDPEGLARARRRQALRGHRERQVLRPEAHGDRRRDPRRGPARHRAAPEAIVASPAVRGGRVYFVTYGRPLRDRRRARRRPSRRRPRRSRAARRAPASRPWVQVVPYEVLLKPGETVTFKARLFDAKGASCARSRPTWRSRGWRARSPTASTRRRRKAGQAGS